MKHAAGMARPTAVGPSDWLWKEGSGYYRESAAVLARRPILADPGNLRDRRLLDLFETHGGLVRGARVLEVGCGRSPWLPLLALRLGARVAGIDSEPYAADLARANLAGAGVRGEIFCGDAFELAGHPDLRGRFDLVYSMGLLEHYADPAARIARLAGYLRPGGRILTTVPNFQGVNWILQRLADLRTLRAHVVHDRTSLRRAHEQAGFGTLAAGYAGFFDAYLASAAGTRSPLRLAIHRRTGRALGLLAAAWVRAGKGRGTPELPFLAPHVFYAGRRSGRAGGPPAAVR